MSTQLLSLVMDIIVLGFLGATIFFVLRLSANLKAFKMHRQEFDRVITDLLSSIDQAERSVQTLKQTSAQEAGHLDDLVKKSKSLAEELTIINAAGENMAQRLEKLAAQGREVAQAMSSKRDADMNAQRISSPVSPRSGQQSSSDLRNYESTLKAVPKNHIDEQSKDLPSFMIKDRDYEDMSSLGNKLDASASNDQGAYGDDDIIPEQLQSQAERELLAALRGSKRKP